MTGEESIALALVAIALSVLFSMNQRGAFVSVRFDAWIFRALLLAITAIYIAVIVKAATT